MSFIGTTGKMDLLANPFVISESFQKKLASEYRDRTLLNFSSDDLVSVVVTRKDEPAITLYHDEDDNYTTDADIELNSEAAAGIFDALAGLRVERYVPPGPVGHAEVTLTLNRKEDEPIITLILTADPGTATHSGRRGSFTLDQPTWDKLTADLAVKDPE